MISPPRSRPRQPGNPGPFFLVWGLLPKPPARSCLFTFCLPILPPSLQVNRSSIAPSELLTFLPSALPTMAPYTESDRLLVDTLSGPVLGFIDTHPLSELSTANSPGLGGHAPVFKWLGMYVANFFLGVLRLTRRDRTQRPVDGRGPRTLTNGNMCWSVPSLDHRFLRAQVPLTSYTRAKRAGFHASSLVSLRMPSLSTSLPHRGKGRIFPCW